MLLGNGMMFNKIPLSTLGDRWQGMLRDERLPSMDNVEAFTKLNAVPNGYYPPHAIKLARTGGRLAARFTITGAGSLSATAQQGYNISASVSGTGGVDPAQTFLGLIISLVASISGSGGVSSASISAITNLIATITGSGSVSATAAGLADLHAALTGSGDIDGNNTALMDIAATIVSYGALTPEGIRDTVWQAVLANYPDTGTAGNTLALAGSGGVDYTTLATAVWTRAERTLSANGEADIATAVATYAIESGWTIETLLRVFAAVLAGKVSGAGTGTETFRGINDDVDRVVATVDVDGNRTAITLDGA